MKVFLLCLFLVLLFYLIQTRRSRRAPRRELERSIRKIKQDLLVTTESLHLQNQELAALLSHVSDAVLAVGENGRPLFFNARFAFLFRVAHEKAPDRHLSEILRVPSVLEAIELSLRDGESRNVDVVPISIHEQRYFFSISISPLFDPATRVYGALAIFHDVTELKRAELIRSEFVANVSHELRTPLTSMQGYLDTAVEDLRQKRPVEIEHLEIAQKNAERLKHLIYDLLDLSALEGEHEDLDLSKVSIPDISDQVLRQMGLKLSAKNQKVVISDKANSVWADAARLEQVLINLLDNAHKFGPQDSELHLKWERSAGRVLLSVSNSGPGIAPEHHTRLFERFYRVDKARSRELGGTGLGLAIVKHILNRHGGDIRVISSAGDNAGATFVCSFPDPMMAGSGG